VPRADLSAHTGGGPTTINNGWIESLAIGKQVGALPVRRNKRGQREVLLVTNRGKHRWIIPKGWPSARLSDKKVAAREAVEEAGVRGRIRPQALGKYTHITRDGQQRLIKVYQLDVEHQLKRWPEQAERNRAWVSPKEARQLLKRSDLRRIIAAI
jgi:8-oxo-dGTP pyrophosphatase MutT (NUDIX family)